ncbi:DUF4349 domain-containing protein [Pseudoxanthomonas sp. GM95]|uniref:DUF4349 domain-containing protein n=1 Tax=Pseudoxanthomonas sp. GM95 TaxID=1881043 RepID=UPI00158783EA|nr:DUF4349 domain-containing protein [Pseudoxanthomonas sp. GM95]
MRTAMTVAIGVALIGCSQAAQQHASADAPMAEAMSAAPAPPAMPVASMMRAQGAALSASSASDAVEPSKPAVAINDQLVSSAATYTDGQRRFVRTAHARFRVRDTYAAALAIEDLVAQQRGFVVDNQINAQVLDSQTRSIGHARLLEVAEYTVNGTLTVRVPSEHTQPLLRALATQVEFLDARGFEANDVQFDLLGQALAQQRDEQAQQELGAATARNGRADHIAEVIEARRQSRARRDESLIEQRRTQDRIAFSTLTLSLYQPSMLRRTELPDVQAVLRDNAPSFGWRLGQALRSGWIGLQALALRIVEAWPLWSVLIALALGGRVLLRRWRRRRT